MSEEELLKSRGKTFIIHVKLKKYYIFFCLELGERKNKKVRQQKIQTKFENV